MLLVNGVFVCDVFTLCAKILTSVYYGRNPPFRKEPFIRLTYEPRPEKTGFFICENKDADQLRGNREADQRLCFRYRDSTIPLIPKSKISSH